MAPRHIIIAAAFTAVLALGGCASFLFSKPREAWREEVAMACLRSGVVRESPYIRLRKRLNGPGNCGAGHPFVVSALGEGSVGLSPTATLTCPMIPALEAWLRETVQQTSYAIYGMPVVKMTVAASYGCRRRNGARVGKMSEHAYANALDVSAFTLADGRTVKVLDGWSGDPVDAVFLRQLHEGACRQFTTVIGPDGDRHHRDHFHLDLARHNRANTYRSCS